MHRTACKGSCLGAGRARIGSSTVRQTVRHVARPQRAGCRRTPANQIRCEASSASWTPVERDAYQVFAAKHSGGRDSALKLLTEAAYNKSVPAEEVEGAILCLEQQPESAKVQRNVDGRWRLVFGTATKVRLFQYIPIDEDFVIQVPENKVALESRIGPLQFEVYGKIQAYRQELNALDFFFCGVNVLLFDWQIYQKVKDYPAKTYTFFYVGDEIAVARSSGGGVALLRPN